MVDCRSGGVVGVRKMMIWRSQTKSTHLKMFQHNFGSNVIGVWDLSEQVPGTHLRIFLETMDASSSSRISNGLNATSDDGRNKKRILWRFLIFFNVSFLNISWHVYLQPGARVTVYVKDVPQEVGLIPGVVVFSLLQHEHKISVLNFTVQRNTEYDGSVRSKVTFPILNRTSDSESLFLSRNPSFSVLALDDYRLTRSTANTHAVVVKVPTTCTNLKNTSATVQLMSPQLMVLWYMESNPVFFSGKPVTPKVGQVCISDPRLNELKTIPVITDSSTPRGHG